MMKYYIILFFLMTGCASYNPDRLSDYMITSYIHQERYDEIINEFNLRLKDTKLKDQIPLLLNKAYVLFLNKKYQESNKILTIIKKLDQSSSGTVGEELNKLLISGDYNKYELSIHERSFLIYLSSLNDLLLKQKKPISNFKEYYPIPKDKSAFLYYLSGVYYESEELINDALIDYSIFMKKNKDFPFTEFDINRLKAKDYDPRSQLIIFFNSGLGPVKQPHERHPNIPKYVKRLNLNKECKIYIDGKFFAETTVLFDLSSEAILSLNQNYKQMVINDLKRIGSKELISIPFDILSGGTASLVSRAILHSNGGDDFRQWSILPDNIQFSRLFIANGTHDIMFQLKDKVIKRKINIKPNSFNYEIINSTL